MSAPQVPIVGIMSLILFGSVMLAGVVLIVVGFRGRSSWSNPYCMKCKYDLRGRAPEETASCPECGADLAGRKAVGFVRHGRRSKLIVLGVCVILLPFVLGAVSLFAMWQFSSTGSHNLSGQANSAVLAYIQNHMDDSRGWDELADRIRNGTLSAAEAERALRDLTQNMVAQRPNGWNEYLYWLDEFLEAGYNAGLFSDAAVIDFIDAYLGKAPRIEPLGRVLIGRRKLDVEVYFGSLGGMQSDINLPLEMLWVIDRVTIGGEPVELQYNDGAENGYGYATVVLPELSPGDYELEVTLDVAIVESRYLVGFDKGKASPDDWPAAIGRGPVSAKTKLTVRGMADEPVSLSIDPSLDPGADGLRVKHLVVQPERGKHRVTLELEVKDGLQTVLSYDVAIELGGQRHGLKSMYYHGRQNRQRSYRGLEQTLLLDELDESVTTADVILTPNPHHVFDRSEIDAVWGEPIVLEGVPMKRYDVQGNDNE